MVGRTKTRTVADQRRFDALKELGCVACRLEGLGYEPPDIHHVLSGGRRMGHQHTCPLCPWHHKGENHTPLSDDQVRALRGPSLAKEKCAFVERYGTEGQLVQVATTMMRGMPA